MKQERVIDLDSKQYGVLKRAIESCIPNKEVWAYGSRAKWNANKSADLDLVVFDCDSSALAAFRDALEESNLIISVDVMNWENIPDNFKENIKRKYAVVQKKLLPAGWQVVTLKNICIDISYGYTSSSINENVGPKFLRITDIVPYKMNWETVPYCRIDVKNKEKYLLHKGDIVIARTGAKIGYNKIIKDDVESIFSSYLIRYKVNGKIALPQYISHILQSSYWKSFVENIKEGSVQQSANAKQFANFKINLPPLPEQKAITEVLCSLDDKIDLLYRQNKTLEAIAQTLFRKCFVEDMNDYKMQERVKISEIMRFTKGRKPQRAERVKFDNSMPQILIETFDDGKLLYSEKDNMVIAEETDILMVMDGTSSGRTEIGFCGVVGSTIGVFRPLGNFNYPLFIFYFLKQYEDYIKANTTGSVIPHADTSIIFNLEISFSSIEKISKFEKTVKLFFEKKKFNRSQIFTLKKLRNTILPKIMSGKTRIKKMAVK